MISEFLNPQQTTCLRAVFNRIIPSDDFPGAWENGCGAYLARQFGRDLAPLLEFYRAGLEAIDAEAQVSCSCKFAELDFAAQDELLSSLESGQTQTNWPEAQRFFEMLVNHSAEGYYADPGNGGNRAKASWQMIGFLDR